jgi:hypothetical protein
MPRIAEAWRHRLKQLELLSSGSVSDVERDCRFPRPPVSWWLSGLR